MACDFGQKLQDEFDQAVAVRVQLEQRKAERVVVQEAKVKESGALQRRSFHIRECQECWVNPPRLRKPAVVYGPMTAAG